MGTSLLRLKIHSSKWVLSIVPICVSRLTSLSPASMLLGTVLLPLICVQEVITWSKDKLTNLSYIYRMWKCLNRGKKSYIFFLEGSSNRLAQTAKTGAEEALKRRLRELGHLKLLPRTWLQLPEPTFSTSQPPLTPIPGHQAPSSGLCRHCTYLLLALHR